MRALSAAELLHVWEHGLTQSLVQRALALLVVAGDDEQPDMVAQLSIGQRDTRLMTLREWAFGGRIDGIVTCPGCGERLEMTFEISDIRASPRLPDSGAGQAVESFGLSLGDYALLFRLPNSADLSAVVGASDVAVGYRKLFERCILSAQRNGTDLSAADLPDDVVAAATAGMAEADPQADVQIALTCPACTQPWQATFDILSYFWHEIDDWAQRILRDVHTLASAYGWREADILALSPRRRQLYLDMVR